METSKAYFEDFLRRFETERRRRTLFQFCPFFSCSQLTLLLAGTVQATLKIE